MGWDNDGHVQHEVFYFHQNNKGPWRVSMPLSLLWCICVMVGGEINNDEKKKMSTVENIKVEPNKQKRE